MGSRKAKTFFLHMVSACLIGHMVAAIALIVSAPVLKPLSLQIAGDSGGPLLVGWPYTAFAVVLMAGCIFAAYWFLKRKFP